MSAHKAIDKFDESATVSRPIDLREIEQFWNDYVNALPCDLEIIWDAIDNGLVRYLEVIFVYQSFIECIWICLKLKSFLFIIQVLKRRKDLTEECELLRRQNAEIEHLLQQYSKNEST